MSGEDEDFSALGVPLDAVVKAQPRKPRGERCDELEFVTLQVVYGGILGITLDGVLGI